MYQRRNWDFFRAGEFLSKIGHRPVVLPAVLCLGCPQSRHRGREASEKYNWSLEGAVSSPGGLGSSPWKIWDLGPSKRLETAFPALAGSTVFRFKTLRNLKIQSSDHC